MSRTRRRIRPPDDPRLPREQRQKSGVNLMHEEPWFGFNVVDKMPARNDLDPAGSPFLGLPANRLKFQDISEAEQVSNSTTNRVLATFPHIDTGPPNGYFGAGNTNQDADRAVSGAAIRTKTIDGYHIKDNAFGDRVIAGMDVDKLLGPVDNRHLANGLDGGKLAKNSVPSDNIAGLHGSKINGAESIPWDRIKVSGVVFTPRLESRLAQLKRAILRETDSRYQKKP